VIILLVCLRSSTSAYTVEHISFELVMKGFRPPLWSNDQSSSLQILELRVQFPALPHFQRSSGSRKRSTQPREYNWGTTRKKKQLLRSRKREYSRRDPLCWPCNTLYPQKLALTSPTTKISTHAYGPPRPVTGIDFLYKQVSLHFHFSFPSFVRLIDVFLKHFNVLNTLSLFKL
jgi:hypothetical protein